ncbi:MAG: hypothetical protein ACLPQS_17375 [Acidimicrobiales bacterium]
MKTAEWKQVVRPLLPAGDDWAFRGALCYRLPVRRVLLGVLGEGSGFDTGVYVWRVLMPLFVPSRHVVLSWSERIGGGACKYDNIDKQALTAAIAKALGGLEGETSALNEVLARDDPASPNGRLHEVVGYSRLLLGDVAGARQSLARAAAGVPTAAWGQEVVDRCVLIAGFIDDSDLDKAVGQLDSWCEESAGALGLRR